MLFYLGMENDGIGFSSTTKGHGATLSVEQVHFSEVGDAGAQRPVGDVCFVG